MARRKKVSPFSILFFHFFRSRYYLKQCSHYTLRGFLSLSTRENVAYTLHISFCVRVLSKFDHFLDCLSNDQIDLKQDLKAMKRSDHAIGAAIKTKEPN